MREDQFTSIQTRILTSNSEESSLLHAVMPIISILIILKDEIPADNVQTINAFLVRSINTFEQTAYRLSFSTRHILATKYCLCTALDEAIMCTSWGQEGSWDEMSLLGTFYKETFGGERFYIIVDTLLEDPATNIQLLEILYILLALGFKGKNYNKDPLLQKAILSDLFTKIEPYFYHKHDYFLSPNRDAFPKKPETYSLWFIVAFLFILIMSASITFEYFIEHITHPFFKTINSINTKMEIENKNRNIQ